MLENWYCNAHFLCLIQLHPYLKVCLFCTQIIKDSIIKCHLNLYHWQDNKTLNTAKHHKI